MLLITIDEKEYWDEVSQSFLYSKKQDLQLEHSLVSLSKWESKWLKSFINSQKSQEEIIDYVRCMTITQNVDPIIYTNLSNVELDKIVKYIEAPMTATTFSNNSKHIPNREIITSEIIYYWMISYNIPFECQKWHINRLLTLIKVCQLKSQPGKKMSTKEALSKYRNINSARRSSLNTTG